MFQIRLVIADTDTDTDTDSEYVPIADYSSIVCASSVAQWLADKCKRAAYSSKAPYDCDD